MMTFRDFHDAIKALCPEGGSFSAGVVAWTNEFASKDERYHVDYQASVHDKHGMIAHSSTAPTAETTVESIRAQLAALSEPVSELHAEVVADRSSPA